MFMYHPDYHNIGEGRYYSRGWKGFKEKDIFELADLTLAYAVSPCLWKTGTRNKVSYAGSDWLGLDFDNGLSLGEGLEVFTPYKHIIGTTKSHQVEKKGIKCDRYRVFLKLEKSCLVGNDYEETVKKWIFKHGADTACSDCARFFWPCQKIVSISENGKLAKIFNTETVKFQKKRQFFQNRTKKIDNEYKKNGSYPPWIFAILEGGCESNQRNIITLKIGIKLLRMGYKDFEIVGIIKDSQIPHCGDHDFGKEEIERCINNAKKYV